MNQNPPTDEQLNQIEARIDEATRDPWLHTETEDARVLLGEVRRLRATLEEIRHLHKDSPMGPCPVCIDADAAAAGGDGLVPYPCPTGRLAGAQDCDPPHLRAAAPASAVAVSGGEQ